MLKIGIVGSRRRDSEEDYLALVNALNQFCIDYAVDMDNIRIVSGGCPEGGDRFAEIIAKHLGHEPIIHYPDKSQLPARPQRWDYAKINYDRNTLIAQDADVLFAVVAPDRKGGTEDTVKKFKKMKKLSPLIIVK